jgi:hypothetical protein
VLNDVVAQFAHHVAGMDVRTPRGSQSTFNYVIQPYGGGSDHMMFIDRKIPAMMFSHSPDYTHHTSEDTPDKVDPVELERAELIGSGAALTLANLQADRASRLTALVGARAIEAIVLAYGRDLTASSFAFETERQVMAIRSVRHFNDSDAVNAEVKRQVELVESAAAALSSHLSEANTSLDDKRVPVRLTRGPLAFDLPESSIASHRAEWYTNTGEGRALSNAVRFETVNFVDGQRAAEEIAQRVVTEFPAVSAPAVARLIEDMVKAGVLSWR